MAGPDPTVMLSAYQTAQSLGASDKVMLALFEAGWVESRFQNLGGGDRDSAGFLQQRPSQGWGTLQQVMNVPHATTAFVSRAKPQETRFATAGQLAQAVQRSAFPLRYDAARAKAQELLDETANRAGGSTVTDVANSGVQGFSAGDALSGLTGFLGFITDVSNWVRIGYFVGGLILVVVAIFKLTGNNQLSPTTKALAKKAVEVAVMPK